MFECEGPAFEGARFDFGPKVQGPVGRWMLWSLATACSGGHQMMQVGGHVGICRILAGIDLHRKDECVPSEESMV